MKLTEYQNQKITDVLCKMILDGETPDKIREARRLLVTECEAMNISTEKEMKHTAEPSRPGLEVGVPDRSPV